ncbi:hypothetical protein CQW23_14851 [Capsicum baccatum]|uniref:NAC domain-containing protein n=1 Tax=Capsicum baccatum TaxID=33114 RepID=A0A2G2WKC3_CAPBA|nr:hypothetical protein CQW23_14851 [Capsicum baccatum]
MTMTMGYSPHHGDEQNNNGPFLVAHRDCTTSWFRPIDEELISYLLKFVCGKPIEGDHIRMLDLYGNKKPCDIFDDLSPDGEFTDVNYLFTQLMKKSTGGKNIKRTVLGGGDT